MSHSLEKDTPLSAQVFPNFALKKQCEAFAASPAYIQHVAKMTASPARA
jgi:hypothetical protein